MAIVLRVVSVVVAIVYAGFCIILELHLCSLVAIVTTTRRLVLSSVATRWCKPVLLRAVCVVAREPRRLAPVGVVEPLRLSTVTLLYIEWHRKARWIHAVLVREFLRLVRGYWKAWNARIRNGWSG